MGARGPAPKRSSERRRRNAVAGESRLRLDETVAAPPPPPKLHPIARRLYRSLEESGQSQFFEPSDWQAARLAAELTSRMLSENYTYFSRHWQECDNRKCKCEIPAGEVNPKSIEAIWKIWTSLMVTETERRRSHVEIERGAVEVSNKPTAIDEYRKALGS